MSARSRNPPQPGDTHSHLKEEGKSEGPVRRDVAAGERDPVGDYDAGADQERLEDQERSSKMGRRNLTSAHKKVSVRDCCLVKGERSHARDVDGGNAGKRSDSDS